MAKKPRVSDDALLRKRGFKVHARPNTGVATWERHGKVYFENAAVVIARREQEADDRIMKELGK